MKMKKPAKKKRTKFRLTKNIVLTGEKKAVDSFRKMMGL